MLNGIVSHKDAKSVIQVFVELAENRNKVTKVHEALKIIVRVFKRVFHLFYSNSDLL